MDVAESFKDSDCVLFLICCAYHMTVFPLVISWCLSPSKYQTWISEKRMGRVGFGGQRTSIQVS